MFSKLQIVISGIVIGAIIGCAGENEFSTVPPAIKFDSPKFQCLKNFDTTVSDFLDGRLPNSKVEVFWNCLDLAVVEFVSYVQGANGKTYKPEELVKFIGDVFLGDATLSQETDLIQELMEIKRLFVGGSTSVITHDDLYVQGRRFIQELKLATLELNPHMKVLHDGLASPIKDSGIKESEVKNAILAMNSASLRMARLFRDSQGYYSFSHLMALVRSLESYMRKSDPNFDFGNTKKYIPVFAELKGLLVAQPYDLVRNQDWTELFGMLSEVMGWALQYRFYVEDQDWDQGKPLAVLDTIVQQALGVLEKAVSGQPRSEFSYVDLDRFLDQIEDFDILPMDLDAPTLKEVLRRLGTRSLSATGSTTGWDLADVRVLSSEVGRWLEAQHYINDVLNQSQVVARGGASEMASLMRSSDFPLRVDAQGRLEFSEESLSGQWDRYSLTTLNWQRAIIRGLMRGYAVQTSPDGATGLSQEQLVLLANDWQALAQKLGLFEVGKAEATAKKIFMESNLFLPASNGNDRTEFAEAVQYLAYGVSGLHASGIIRDQMLDRCGAPGAPNKLDAQCYRATLYAQRRDFLVQLPIFLSDMGDDRSRFEEFFANVEYTTRGNVSDDPIARGDIVKELILVQFIETFFAKFDSTNDQRINVDETLAAFPVFKRSLDEIVRSGFGMRMNNDELLALFTFFFKYGKPPQSNLGGAIKFLNWRWTPERWSYNEDRRRVSKILAELNANR